MTTQTYMGITAQKYNQLEAALSEDKDAPQAALHKTGGSATYRGVSFAWTYVPEACNLVVSIINKRALRALSTTVTSFKLAAESFILSTAARSDANSIA